VDSVLQRADEPGEALAYWTATYGRAIPKPVKHGIADAVGRLYTERSLLKYDNATDAFASPTSSTWSTRPPRRTSPGRATCSSMPWTVGTAGTTTSRRR
jgi:hypothetical protein